MRRIDTILLAAALFLAVSCNWNEIIVDVKPMLPEIVLDNSSAVYSMTAGEQLTVSPIYKYVVGATYAWTCDGKVLSNESVLHYTDTVAHTVFIKITVTTEYGSTSDEIRVDVLAPPPDPDPEPVPDDDFWVFPQTVFNVSLGRSIQLKPYDIKEADDIDYVWTVNGSEVQASKASEYIFEAKQEGSYDVCVTHGKLSQTLTVNVCPAEGTFYRPASATSDSAVSRIFEFTPAPGQYVNEDYTANTPEEAVAYVAKRFSEVSYVSLGGFGGCLIAGFDHSVDNSGGYDISITSHLSEEYTEAGVVWVMQDENGDGLPNDTWYELKASDTFAETTIHDYSVTYYKPSSPGMSVQWTDNQGGKGVVNYMGAYHHQDWYYPLWIAEDHYTLRGTRLEAHNYDRSGTGTYWVNPPYGWGYVDNWNETDMLGSKDTNHFKISDAIKYDGSPANLKYIDFVKVQNALNASSGWLGEISTEVCGIYDHNMTK
ncbi:MAG: cell surface protein [Bacteroidales bacterium]|nr:cell surface protein [Bacteroidales bacterium]